MPPDTASRPRVVIVGGGPTGVELAGALAEIARNTLAQEFRGIAPAAARIILVEVGRSSPRFPSGCRMRRATRSAGSCTS